MSYSEVACIIIKDEFVLRQMKLNNRFGLSWAALFYTELSMLIIQISRFKISNPLFCDFFLPSASYVIDHYRFILKQNNAPTSPIHSSSRWPLTLKIDNLGSYSLISKGPDIACIRIYKCEYIQFFLLGYQPGMLKTELKMAVP